MDDTGAPTKSARLDGIPDAALSALQALLGNRLSLSLAEREQHGRGESYHATCPPDAVCFALTTKEVS